jgi:hypothetical protein
MISNDPIKLKNVLTDICRMIYFILHQVSAFEHSDLDRTNGGYLEKNES